MIFDVVTNKLFKALLDGTAKVGKAKDAEQLGGKGANEYALAQQIKDNSIWNELTEGFDLNNAFGKYRTTSGALIGTLLNLPPTLTVVNIELSVEWIPFIDNSKYGMQVLNARTREESHIYFRTLYGGTTWNQWKELATTADLANKLDKTGGAISANSTSPVSIQSTNSDDTCVIPLYGKDDVVIGTLGFRNGLPIIRIGSGTWNEVLHAGNYSDYALPKSGVIIEDDTSHAIPLTVKRTTADGWVYIEYFGRDKKLGSIGFDTVDSPVYCPSSGNPIYKLLHSGNVGSYALPITGGVIEDSSGTRSPNAPLIIRASRNLTQNKTLSLLGFLDNTEAVLGYLGFDGVMNPVLRYGGANYSLHHTGNSAKVVFTQDSTTAPAADALWAHL